MGYNFCMSTSVDPFRLRRARFADLSPFEVYALCRLRVDVFVVEQHCAYPELDGRDAEPDTRHLWIAGSTKTPAPAGEPVAYLRILADMGGVARIGRVVVAKHARGAGHAARLMTAALELIGDRPCVLDAQSQVLDFYARRGFVATGEEYIEDGIPHFPMRRG